MMFKKLKESWRLARAETLVREVEDILRRIGSAGDAFNAKVSLAMVNGYLSLVREYGPLEGLSQQNQEHIAKAIMRRAKNMFGFQEYEAYGLAMLGSYVEALYLPGPEALLIRNHLKELLHISLKVKDQLEDMQDKPIDSLTKSSDLDKDFPFKVEKYLDLMGYDIIPDGIALAILSGMSGYNAVETASHIALVTLALDIREAENNIDKLINYSLHGRALLDVLTELKDQGVLNPDIWKNDANAILGICILDSKTEGWIEKVLSNPTSPTHRLAKSRIKSS